MKAKAAAVLAKPQRSKSIEPARVGATPTGPGSPREAPERADPATQRRCCERLAAVEQVATVMAHDLRNYLGTIRNASYLLGQCVTEGARSEDMGVGEILQILDRAIASCSQMVSELAESTRRPHHLQPTAVAPLVRDAVARVALPPGVALDIEVDDSLPTVMLDRDEVLVALLNLIENAAAAIPKGRGGRVRIGASLSERDLYLRISDDGVGIPAELLSKLGRPLVHGKPLAGGAVPGLGLAIVANIAKRHGGLLIAERPAEAGTSLVLRLPRDGASPDADAAFPAAVQVQA